MSRQFWFCTIAIAILAGSTLAVAQNRKGVRNVKTAVKSTASSDDKTSSATANTAKPKRKRNPMALTAPRKAAALEFARRHHPELAGLLVALEKKSKGAYRRAMTQLYITSERLAKSRERLPADRFELELDLWKLESRIRLLAARLTISRIEGKKRELLEKELQQALLDRVGVQIRRLERDRARTTQRLEKLNANIAGLEADRDKAAAQYLNRVKRGLGIKNRKGCAKKRPNRKKKSESQTKSD